MKKLLIFFTLLLTIGQAQAQIVNIPDPNFQFRLLHHTGFGGVQIDTNLDGHIQVSEAEAITELFLGDPFATENQITNMTGIEAFVNITNLQCLINQIESLDLSQNTLLEYLNCQDNNINSLNVSQCLSLIELNCNVNNLYSLDVSQNIALEELNCNENYLTSIDVTQNQLLTSFGCYENLLTFINVTQNHLLEYFGCPFNQLTDLDVSQNTLLKGFICGHNQLTSLDVSYNPFLYSFSFDNNYISDINLNQCTQLEWLWGNGNQLINIDLSFNPSLKIIRFEDNLLTSIDVRNGNNEIIGQFNTTGNTNLECIFVDDAQYSTQNWTDIDPNSHFVETQAECDAIGITEDAFANDITIYPNPTTGLLFIDQSNSPFEGGLGDVIITDVLGRDISTLLDMTIQYNNSGYVTECNLSKQPTGIYFLKIKTNNSQILIHKIIKL